MRTLLSESFAPITSAIGFLEAPLELAAREMESWRGMLHPAVRVERVDDGFPDVLRRLEPLKSGTRSREILVGTSGGWTAYFANGLRGSDPEGVIGHMSRNLLRCQAVTADAFPHTYSPSTGTGRMGSVRFRLFGPLPAEFLNYVRTVSVAYDGSRWQFHALGTEQAFEEPERYTARRVRDRFTSDVLERYCQALGIDVFDPNFYGPDAVSFESTVNPAPGAPEPTTMTLAQAQEWLGIIPGEADALPG